MPIFLPPTVATHPNERLESWAVFGVLRVGEVRDHELGRPVLIARLLDPTTKVDTDLLPSLGDSQLLSINGRQIRIAGIERLKDSDVTQTWLVEVE